MKIKVLVSSEASYLNTGYGKYALELLKYLHSRPEYEVAEFASAGTYDPKSPRYNKAIHSVPWKVYCNIPDKDDQRAQEAFNANPINEFGKFRFEPVCLEFKPDVVLSFRDYWMDAHIDSSPFRRCYKWVHMPTIDAEPQKAEWLDTYRRADILLTYSDWAIESLKKQKFVGNVFRSAPPAGTVELGQIDKQKEKARLRIPEGFIAGCFAPGTKVLMGDYSLKNIEDIIVGDLVCDHLGKVSPVTHTHVFPSDKKMVSINVMGEPEDIVCTYDHEILSVRRDDVTAHVCSTGQVVIHNPMLPKYNTKHDGKWSPGWIEANKLKTGDFIAFRIPNDMEDIELVPGTSIEVSEEFLFASGLYLAEGYIASREDCLHHSVVWNINKDDNNTIDTLLKCIKSISGKDAKIEKPTKGTVRISLHNTAIARVWNELFGTGSCEKRLPSWFAKLPPKKQLVLVRGWQTGDGCRTNGRNIGVSVNLSMIHQLRVALLRNGIVASINKRNMDTTGLYENAKQQWRLVEKVDGKRHMQFIHNGYLYSYVNSVSEHDYSGENVYDLTVSGSHSYSVYCKCVHNTVMRNQPRKMYDKLFSGFAKSMRDKRAYLYCHTCYPDVGWDIPELAMTYGIFDKILFTYVCRACEHHFVSKFNQALAHCPKCAKHGAVLAGTQHGVSHEELARIISTFDVYCQIANSEGFGLPQVEAAAVGVPVIATDYSAMSDVVRKLSGIPIRYTKSTEVESGCIRAIPDENHIAEVMNEIYDMSQAELSEWSDRTYEAYKTNYRWEDTVATWGEAIQKVYRPGLWGCQPKFCNIPDELPNVDNAVDLIKYCYCDILDRKDLFYSHEGQSLITQLAAGFNQVGRRNIQKVSPKQIMDKIINRAKYNNMWESRRIGNA